MLRVASPSSIVLKIILLFAMRYLLSRVSWSDFPVTVGDISVGDHPGRVYLLYSYNAALKQSWNAICIRRVKLCLPHIQSGRCRNSQILGGSMKQACVARAYSRELGTHL